MTSKILLPHSRWVDAAALELALCESPGSHESRDPDTEIVVPWGSKAMIDAAVRLLSLANQLDHAMKAVCLTFEEGEVGTMGYLNRMGFFDNVSKRVAVKPDWLQYSGAEGTAGRMQSGVATRRRSAPAHANTRPNPETPFRHPAQALPVSPRHSVMSPESGTLTLLCRPE